MRFTCDRSPAPFVRKTSFTPQPGIRHDDHEQVRRVRRGRGPVGRNDGSRVAGRPETGRRRRREPSAVRGGPRGGARAEAERQVRGPGRVQLRHAEAGHVHEQADEEEHAGVRRRDGDRKEGRRRTVVGRRGDGARAGLGPRVQRRVCVRSGDGREALAVRAVPVAQDQAAARGRLRRVRVPGTRRLAQLRHVLPHWQGLAAIR